MKRVNIVLGLREAQMLAIASRSLMDDEGRLTAALSLLHLTPEEATVERLRLLGESGRRSHRKLRDAVRIAEADGQEQEGLDHSSGKP